MVMHLHAFVFKIRRRKARFFLFTMVQQPWWAKASSLSRIHDHIQLDTLLSVGLPWMSDQPQAITPTRQHTTLTRDKHPCPWQDSYPQSQKARGHKSTH